RMRLNLWLLLACLAFAVAACGGDSLDEKDSGGSSGGDKGKPSVTVGSANFPENTLLAEIYAGALEAKDFKVTKKLNIGSRETIFPAMERGDLTLLPEYTGTLLSFVTKGKAKATDTQAQVAELKSALPAKLTMLEPSAAEDKDTVTCTKEVVDKYQLKSLDDLAKVSKNVTMGGPPEMPKREGFGLKGLKEIYGIDFKKFRPLDVAGPLTVSALKSGKVDCADLFSTQSAIPANGFITLEDPKGIVAHENVTPLIAKDKATPEVSDVLNGVSAKLTTENLKELVKRVEIDKDDAKAVADDFLSQNGLK
ncbi:MAG TPA: ABC transporter substrate-binding protein, partial [Solirubrobacteraceae bacterium]|nr:ABC transporter substrate-binding protein [Solirubrobacteraceae bacterium]